MQFALNTNVVFNYLKAPAFWSNVVIQATRQLFSVLGKYFKLNYQSAVGITTLLVVFCLSKNITFIKKFNFNI